MRLLIKFPTRGRPQKFLKVLQLYRGMLSGLHDVNILVSCDSNDPTMNNEEMKAALSLMEGVEVHYGNNKSKIAAINADMDSASDWDVLLLASDDMIPEVEGYDDQICQDMQRYFPDLDGVLWYNDGYTGDRLNTLVIMGQRYYRRFGYIYHPDYVAVWCDNEFTDVSKLLKKQIYLDRVLIRHRHPANDGTVASDKIYAVNDAYYGKDQATYQRRKAQRFDVVQLREQHRSKSSLLSILICTLNSRQNLLSFIEGKLLRQIEACGEKKAVEVIHLADDGEMPIGRKRNLLVEYALGEYVCFVDDDDDVAPTYIQDLLAAIRDGKPDCVMLLGRVYWGGIWKPFVCSKRYRSYSQSKKGFWRSPNHLSPIKRSIVRQHPFPAHKSFGEDSDFAASLVKSGAIKTEVATERPLYFYTPRPTTSEDTCKRLRYELQAIQPEETIDKIGRSNKMIGLHQRRNGKLMEGTVLCAKHDTPEIKKRLAANFGRAGAPYRAGWFEVKDEKLWCILCGKQTCEALPVVCTSEPVCGSGIVNVEADVPSGGASPSGVYSQNDEEIVIVEFFGKRTGRFLDIGACDGKKFSNTYRLFELGWGGVCVEPNPYSVRALMETYKDQTGRVTIVNAAVLEKRGFAEFEAVDDFVSTFDKEHKSVWKKRMKSEGKTYTPIHIFAVELADLLKAFPGPYEMVNIDAEGRNWEVLKRMDLVSLGVELLCVEHDNATKQIDGYCSGFGFERVAVNAENAIYVKRKA